MSTARASLARDAPDDAAGERRATATRWQGQTRATTTTTCAYGAIDRGDGSESVDGRRRGSVQSAGGERKATDGHGARRREDATKRRSDEATTEDENR